MAQRRHHHQPGRHRALCRVRHHPFAILHRPGAQLPTADGDAESDFSGRCGRDVGRRPVDRRRLGRHGQQPDGGGAPRLCTGHVVDGARFADCRNQLASRQGGIRDAALRRPSPGPLAVRLRQPWRIGRDSGTRRRRVEIDCGDWRHADCRAFPAAAALCAGSTHQESRDLPGGQSADRYPREHGDQRHRPVAHRWRPDRGRADRRNRI